MNRIDECLMRAQHFRRRATCAETVEQRERFINLAALWDSMAEVLRQEYGPEELLTRLPDEGADADELEFILRTIGAQGSA